MNKRIYIAVAAVFLLLVAVLVVLLGVDWNTTVGICYMDQTDQSNYEYRQALEQGLMDRGMKIVVASADNDHANQLSLIRQLLERRCDALVIEPVANGYGTELLELLNNSHIPSVLINQQIDSTLIEAYPYITCVGADTAQTGVIQAQMVMQLPDGGDVNGDGVVSYMVLQGPENSQLANLRTATFCQAMEAGQLQTQLLAVSSGDWTRESGMARCREQMSVFGKDIEVIVCSNDQLALGAAQAIADNGWKQGENVYLFGIGAEQDALALIQQGQLTGTVSSDVEQQVRHILETVIDQLGGEKVSNKDDLQHIAVTAENVEEFLK